MGTSFDIGFRPTVTVTFQRNVTAASLSNKRQMILAAGEQGGLGAEVVGQRDNRTSRRLLDDCRIASMISTGPLAYGPSWTHRRPSGTAIQRASTAPPCPGRPGPRATATLRVP